MSLRKRRLRKWCSRSQNIFVSLTCLNGAGVCYRYPVLETPEDEFDRQNDVLIEDAFLMGQAGGNVMKEQKGGSIINIASDRAFCVDTTIAAYCAAKAGVVMITCSLARELGNYGVRANSIRPGLAGTELSRAAWELPEVIQIIRQAIAPERIAELEDRVPTAIFLAPDASNFITGSAILVNGGGENN